MTGERDVEALVRRHLTVEAEELPFDIEGEGVRRRLEQKQRGRWRSLALLPVAAAAVTLAVLAGQVLVAGPGGPSGSDRPAGGAGAWGPLAVVPPLQGFDAALAVGALHITDVCVFLEETGGDQSLLVWPADQTTWEAAARAIHFTNVDGTGVTLRDGDRVTFGGGGDSTKESGLSGAEWVERLEWVARPDPSCPIDVRWSVNEVVTGDLVGTLHGDADLETGCAWLTDPTGKQWEILWPEGYRIAFPVGRDPVLTRPGGEIVARAGDVVALSGAPPSGLGSHCMVGELFAAIRLVGAQPQGVVP